MESNSIGFLEGGIRLQVVETIGGVSRTTKPQSHRSSCSEEARVRAVPSSALGASGRIESDPISLDTELA